MNEASQSKRIHRVRQGLQPQWSVHASNSDGLTRYRTGRKRLSLGTRSLGTRKMAAIFQALTAEEVKSAAATLLGSRPVTVRVLPS